MLWQLQVKTCATTLRISTSTAMSLLLSLEPDLLLLLGCRSVAVIKNHIVIGMPCKHSRLQLLYAGKMTTRGEQVLWQQQYLNCCSELGQWDVVHEYARGTENYAAFMDVAWKCSDWQGLKEWVLPKGAVGDTPRGSMVKAYVLLQDGDVTSANLHTENAITQTLHR